MSYLDVGPRRSHRRGRVLVGIGQFEIAYRLVTEGNR